MKKNKLNAAIRASSIKNVLTKGKSGRSFGETANTYAIEIAMAHFGVHAEEVTSKEMEWGNEYEWLAIQEYQARTMATVEDSQKVFFSPCGIITGHPDGIVGHKKIIEVKCPYNPKYHVLNLLEGKQFKTDYYPQVQTYLYLTGAEVADCISFDPRAKHKYECLGIYQMDRNEKFITNMVERCHEFWEKLVLPTVERIGNTK